MATFTMHKRIHTKSGGRQPAVAIGNRACKSATAIAPETASVARTCVVADAFPQPRGAYADRSRSRPDPRSRAIRKFPCMRVPRPTGGLRPSLLSRAFAQRRNYDFYDAQTHTHQERRMSARRGSATTHAGEIANRKQARTRTAPGAASVSPPWRSRIALAKALPQLLGRLPALHGRASLPMRYPNHGGLTPTAPGHARIHPHVGFASSPARASRDPRGAYAHRSLVQQHAFVHRESRFSTGKRTTNIRAAGVSPP